MAKIDDGGPAFPADFNMATFQHDFNGMSLRDYFAGQALDSNMREAFEWYKAWNSCDVYARAATGSYRAADAMLAARTLNAAQPQE